MEIDVREDSGDKPDVIRFGENKNDILQRDSYDNTLVIGIPDEGDMPVTEATGWLYFFVKKQNIPNLIKALKKYQELYGED